MWTRHQPGRKFVVPVLCTLTTEFNTKKTSEKLNKKIINCNSMVVNVCICAVYQFCYKHRAQVYVFYVCCTLYYIICGVVQVTQWCYAEGITNF